MLKVISTIVIATIIASAAAPAKEGRLELAQRTIDKLQMKANWEEIRVLNEKWPYGLSLYYRAEPSGFTEIEEDTKAIARALLAEIMAAGEKPPSTLHTIEGHVWSWKAYWSPECRLRVLSVRSHVGA